MIVLGIALVGVATVLASILWIKIHPFLALVLGSLVVLALQPFAVEKLQATADQAAVSSSLTDTAPKTTAPFKTITQRLSRSIADTFDKIGLSILMASIVGVCLLESGSAVRIVQAIQNTLGGKRTLPALSVSGFLMSIPVYFDTVFYLLLPLAKAFAKKRGGDYLMAVMAIIVGATMAHSLVPPTPGPLLVATQLGVPIGTMMLGGVIVGGIASTIGFSYGAWCNRHIKIDGSIQENETQDTSITNIASVNSNDSESSVDSSNSALLEMSFAFAILPLFIPAVLIAGGEMAKAFLEEAIAKNKFLSQAVDTASDASFALCIAATIALLQLYYRCALEKKSLGENNSSSLSNKTVANSISRALADGSMILLITCAGGAFGASLKDLGIADAIAAYFPAVLTPFGLLWLSFLLTAIIRGAQGSATVAMITTVGVVTPLVQSIELPFNTVYIALAIGCGSKPLAWMNDSGFWQVSAMTGMSTKQTLQTFSAALTIMGIVGFTVTLLGARLLPFN